MRIIAGTVCKNIENHFSVFSTFLQVLQDAIPTLEVFIYENNSTDRTKQFLQILNDSLNSCRIKSEDVDLRPERAITWDMKPCRMEMISNARNKLLDMIFQTEPGNDDIIMFFDGDMLNLPTMANLFETLTNFPQDTDAIFANGVTVSGTNYYDLYALRNVDVPIGPEVIGETFWKNLPRVSIHEKTKVCSAFGGLAIYRAKCLSGIRYSAIPTADLDTLNKHLVAQFNPQVPSVQPEIDTHINGCLLGMYYFGNNGLFYWNNSGYNYPVVCEHTTLHASMWVNGHRNMYIDPELKYFSDH